MTAAPPNRGLIDFPCTFPIKVMGKHTENFQPTLFKLIEQLTDRFDPNQSKAQPSRSGKYISLTCQVWVENQDQLDEVYRTLSTHPAVAVVL